jgi:hypothetical protein
LYSITDPFDSDPSQVIFFSEIHSNTLFVKAAQSSESEIKSKINSAIVSGSIVVPDVRNECMTSI